MTTHHGNGSLAELKPAAISSIQMMPMVFCASLPPWPRLYIDADSNCARRNQPSTLRGVERTKIHDTSNIMMEPRMKPSNGDSTMKMTILIRPEDTSEPVPALATAAPTRPPMSACEDDEGIP